jgi:hypothetical protein
MTIFFIIFTQAIKNIVHFPILGVRISNIDMQMLIFHSKYFDIFKMFFLKYMLSGAKLNFRYLVHLINKHTNIHQCIIFYSQMTSTYFSPLYCLRLCICISSTSCLTFIVLISTLCFPAASVLHSMNMYCRLQTSTSCTGWTHQYLHLFHFQKQDNDASIPMLF